MSDGVIIVLIVCITVVVIASIALIGGLVSGRNEVLRYQYELEVINAKKDRETKWVERKDV